MFTFDPAIFALSFEGFVSGDYSTYNFDGKTLFIMDKDITNIAHCLHLSAFKIFLAKNVLWSEKRYCTIQLYKTIFFAHNFKNFLLLKSDPLKSKPTPRRNWDPPTLSPPSECTPPPSTLPIRIQTPIYSRIFCLPVRHCSA
jgi:hypothetical protein